MNRQYTFRFDVTEAGEAGTYAPRWVLSTPVAVIGSNADTAESEVLRLMGEPPRGRVWVARLRSVEPARMVSGVSGDE